MNIGILSVLITIISFLKECRTSIYQYPDAVINLETMSSGTINVVGTDDYCWKLISMNAQLYHIGKEYPKHRYNSWLKGQLQKRVEDRFMSADSISDYSVDPDEQTVAIANDNFTDGEMSFFYLNPDYSY